MWKLRRNGPRRCGTSKGASRGPGWLCPLHRDSPRDRRRSDCRRAPRLVTLGSAGNATPAPPRFSRQTSAERRGFEPEPTWSRRGHERTKACALAWLKRKGYLARREEESNEAPALTALGACAQVAMQRGEFADVRAGGDVAPLERPSYATAVETHGFNVHAGVRIARDDDLAREKLCRYGARPPFAMDRIRRLPGGRIAYQTKAATGQRARSRLMTPVEFLARLAALVPPPRYPLVRADPSRLRNLRGEGTSCRRRRQRAPESDLEQSGATGGTSRAALRLPTRGEHRSARASAVPRRPSRARRRFFSRRTCSP